MPDMGEFLYDVMTDLRHSEEARRVATRLHNGWQAGIVPAPGAIKRLRKLLVSAVPCARMQPDGSCRWLRKHARMEGLRPPGPGERAMCHRKESGPVHASFEGCTGYRKGKPGEDIHEGELD